MPIETSPPENNDSAPEGLGRIVTFPRPPASVNLSDGAPEKFPIAAFPPRLRAVAENLAALYQAPVCLPAMAALAVLSGAVGKSVVVRGGYKDKVTRLNLYVIPVAERGSGKGNIGETLSAPLTRRSRRLADARGKLSAAMRGELGALKKEIATLEGKTANAAGLDRANLLDTLGKRHARLAELEAEAARRVTLLVGNTTSEALERGLEDNNETLFSYSAEAGATVQVALGKYSKSGDGDIDLLLSGYSGDYFKSTRVTRKGVQLESPCIALLWLIQPCIVRQIFNDAESVSRGLTARPLFVNTQARREHDDRRDLEFNQGQQWGELIDQILEQRLAEGVPVREIPCAPEAREVFANFNDLGVDIERMLESDLAGELSRWRENAIKVAGLFALAEGATSITAGLADRAVELVRWSGLNYLSMLQEARAERKRDELDRLEKLLGTGGGEAQIGVLQSAHGFTRQALDALAAAFPAEIEIVRRKQDGPGKPAEFVRLKSKSSISSKSAAGAD